MGAQLSSGRKMGAQPNINVTPLVDVVLVLLIIFMVVLPDVQGGKPVEMVKVAAADKHASDAEPLRVTIDLREVYTWDEADTTRDVALDGLRAEYLRDTKQRVLLRADAGLRYAIVRDFFAEVQDIGFPAVSLAVGVGAEWKEEG
ncbi:MAG: biopolymer transporter ExbD [Nannocystaceae bacterium]|nr:biopolymer transporter ExbD [Nannocystaceae bacterium]